MSKPRVFIEVRKELLNGRVTAIRVEILPEVMEFGRFSTADKVIQECVARIEQA